MWTRAAVVLLAVLGGALSSQAELQRWAQRPDRILVVLLADGLDPSRAVATTERGDPLCPELATWKRESLRYLDVQSGSIDAETGLTHLFGDPPPPLRPLEEIENWAREQRSNEGPGLAVFTTDLFQNVQTLTVDDLLEYDPAPWLGAGTRDDNAAIARKRRSRASQILSQLQADRPLRAILPEPELQWVPETLHRRGDRALATWFAALEQSPIAERCLVVLTARCGALDPLRGGGGLMNPPRPELLRVPVWMRGASVDPGTARIELRSGALMSALQDALRTGEWSQPEAESMRWSVDTHRNGDAVDASVWIRHSDWSLRLDHEGHDAVFDRRVDPAEWDDLASSQAAALSELRQRCTQALVGTVPELWIQNASGRPLLLQPPEAVVATSGGETRRLGQALELTGEGPWKIQFDPAQELRIRAPGEEVPLWQFERGDPWPARQLSIRLGRYEFLAALTQEAPAEAGALRASEGLIRIQLPALPGAMELLR